MKNNKYINRDLEVKIRNSYKYRVGDKVISKEELDDIIRRGFRKLGNPQEVRNIIRYGICDLVVVTFEGEKSIDEGGEFLILNENMVKSLMETLQEE